MLGKEGSASRNGRNASHGVRAVVRDVEDGRGGGRSLEVLEPVLKLGRSRDDGKGDGSVNNEAGSVVSVTVGVLPLLAGSRADLVVSLPCGGRQPSPHVSRLGVETRLGSAVRVGVVDIVGTRLQDRKQRKEKAVSKDRFGSQ